MIARTWHGVTDKSKADDYRKYLEESGVKEYRETKGNRGVYVLRRDEGDRTHFLLVSLWDSCDAIRIATILRRLGYRRVLQPGSCPNRHRVADDARGDPRAFLDDAVPGHHAVDDFCSRPNDAALQHDAVPDDCFAFDPRAVVQAGVVRDAAAPQDGPGPDVARPPDRDAVLDQGGGVEDHGSLARDAGAPERLALPSHDLHARLPEVVRSPDVHPDSVELGAMERDAFREELREQVFREVELLVRRDEIEDLRLEHVDARVREVRERFLPLRLLAELRDPALRIEADDPVLRRVFHLREGDRPDAAPSLVEVVERLEVHIAQDVPHRDDERLVDEVPHPTDGPRGARGVLLEAVQDRRVVVGAVADRLNQGVGEIGRRHDDLVETGRREGSQDVIDARPAGDGHQRLRPLVGERLEPSPLSSGEDDGLHRPISTRPFSRRALNARSAESSSFFGSERARACRFCVRRRSRDSRASARFAPRIERTLSRISTSFAWISSALSRVARYASCFSSPSNTRAEISRTSPSESSWTARASALRTTAASCSFSAAWNSSVIPESMSRTSFAILS